MKQKLVASIDKRLDAFYEDYLDLVAASQDGNNSKRRKFVDSRDSLWDFHDLLCSAVYGYGVKRNRWYWLNEVKEIALDHGFTVAGVGATRLVLVTEYRGKAVAVKVSPFCKRANRSEVSLAKRINKVPEIGSLVLSPLFWWQSGAWGTVVVYPLAPIIDPDRFDPYQPKTLPKDKKTKENVKRLFYLSELFVDFHEFNVGWLDNKPYMIDYNMETEGKHTKRILKAAYLMAGERWDREEVSDTPRCKLE